MSARGLSDAQVGQRRLAAVKHGATARTQNDPVIERRWRRLRKALNKRDVSVREISPKAWLELRLLVRYLVLIERVEPHVMALLDDPKTATQKLVDQYTSWLSGAAAIVARLPADLADAAEMDLGGMLGRRRHAA